MRVLRLCLVLAMVAAAHPARADDDLPIAEPEVDRSGDHLLRDAAWSMTTYQLARGSAALAAALRIVEPAEAVNVNALDEVPDSTWFTNRHARRRLSSAALARGPNGDHAPQLPFVVLSSKPPGLTPGFVARDAKGDRYVIKLDPPGFPDVPTGAEMVCTKIVHALGWNVPENYLVRLYPERLLIAEDAWIEESGGNRRPLTPDDLQTLLGRAGRRPDGSIRVVASRWVPGTAKGGFLTRGTRPDDPDDVVPHEDRRELRGLRVVAAWINYTDARRGNFLDTFVTDDPRTGRGHLVHYLLDFSSALGAGNTTWKPPRYGHEYFFDPPQILLRVVTLGLVKPAWASLPLVHPALGYFDAETFEPEKWRTTYPNPLFDAATVRDEFWGAKLVSSFSAADLAVVSHAGEWSDPRAAELLADLLRRRQRKIAATYFDWRRINPIDDFVVAGGRVRFRDLAVESGVVAAADVRYRRRMSSGPWHATAADASLGGATAAVTLDIESSHDRGRHWSPPTRIAIEPGPSGELAVQAIERATR